MDGITEYRTPLDWDNLALGGFCSDWDGDLIVTPVGGTVSRMDLAADGLSYEVAGNIGINGLDVVVGPDGTIYTATLNSGSVAYRRPIIQSDDQAASFFISCGPGTICDPAGGASCVAADVDSDSDGVPNTSDNCPGSDDRADLSGDQKVDLEDFALLEADFGCVNNCTADINNDGQSDMLDASLLFKAWLCGTGP